MSSYVLVGDDQIPVTPVEAVESVKREGIKAMCEVYDVSEATLRRFLAVNGWHPQRSTTWVKNSAGQEGPDAQGDVLDPG